MTLTEVHSGSTIKIVGFLSEKNLAAKLRQLGMVPGDCATVIRQAPFDGPFLLSVRGREIALGKSIAAKVQVETVECDLL